MSVQVSYKKQVLFGIMLLLVILVVVEGFAKIWWYELESCGFEDSDVYEGVDPAMKRLMCVESFRLQISDERIDPDQDFETININSHGFRGQEVSIQKPENTFRIFGIGGSTMVGSGSTSDVTTIPGYLQNEFDSLNLQYNVEVVNAGIVGAWSLTETNLIKTKLLNFNPDLFIIYDGWNDASKEAGWTENDDNAKQIVSKWVHRWIEICNLGKENNFKTAIFIQPILGTSDRTLSEKEYAMYIKTKDDNTLERLELLANSLGDLEKVCDKTIDLRNAFDGINSPVFWDRGHVGNNGNQIISKKIFEAIYPLMDIPENSISSSTEILDASKSEITNEATKDYFIQLKRFILHNYKTPYLIGYNIGTQQQLVTQQNVKGEDVKTINDIDFSKLSNADFSKGYFPNADFSKQDLSKSNFSGTYLKDSNFKNSKLSEVKFIFANMRGSNLSFTQLESADFRNSDMTGAVLSNSDLRYALFDNAYLYNVNFRESDLSYVDLSYANLGGIDFQGATMESVNLEGHDLRRVFLMNTNLSNANLQGTFINVNYIQDAILSGANLSGVTFSLSKNFSGFDLSNVNFSSSSLFNSDFSNSNLDGVDFSNADLTNANFESSNLEDAIGSPFIGCKNHYLCE